MKFKFRLQPVFDLRQHLESEQKDALARERQKLDTLYTEQRELTEKYAVWSKRYMQEASEGMKPEDAATIHNYLNELDRLLNDVGKRIELQNAVVEKERVELIEKMKDRKTIEALYDKQREKFNYEQGRDQEKEVEELISSRR